MATKCFGRSSKLEFDDFLDSEGDVEVEVHDYGRDTSEFEYLNKEDAEQLIEHLKSLFGI